MEKLCIQKPVIVEGKYDKNKLSSILDAHIITTDGFGIFRQSEKKEMLRRLAHASGGVIVLTDADGAGLVIRNYINSVLPPPLVTHLYIPAMQGKEKRKDTPSKEGLLGVEGMECALLHSLFLPYAEGKERTPRLHLTKADFYRDRLSGTQNSAQRRMALAKAAGLPPNLSANALLSALCMLYTEEEYQALLLKLEEES